MVLIHGFGACSGHWRYTLPVLAPDCEVIAFDLLGFGGSDKPRSALRDEPLEAGSVRYGFDLWADLVADLAQDELGGRRLHLVGNSIGAMVCLKACLELRQRGQSPFQAILLDCAQRTLDDKRLGEQPPLARLGRPALKSMVRQRWLTNLLFRALARPAVIRQVLLKAYPSGAHVDSELVALLHQPTTDPGAVESFRGFINLFNDHLAPELLAELSRALGPEQPALPVRLLWGGADPWENPEEARRWAQSFPCIQELVVLPGIGHCPHDEAPEQVNPILRRWILGDRAQRA